MSRLKKFFLFVSLLIINSCSELSVTEQYNPRPFWEKLTSERKVAHRKLPELTSRGELPKKPSNITKKKPHPGQKHYQVCISCHGSKGEGNTEMNAPKLAGLQDWYLTRQLKNYREGIRGKHKDDMYGGQNGPHGKNSRNGQRN